MLPWPAGLCWTLQHVSTPATLNVATQELQTKIDATKQQCTQDLTAAETRINNNHLKTSLDNMPQRLPSEEARKSIENALREEFKAQLDQLRKEHSKTRSTP